MIDLILGIGIALLIGTVIFLSFRMLGMQKTFAQDLEEAAREAETNYEQMKDHALKVQRGTLTGILFERIGIFADSFPYNIYDVYSMNQSPCDFVVFDGMEQSQGQEVKNVILLECKTGKRMELAKNQRAIKDCVDAGRVRFVKVSVDDTGKWYVPKGY